MKIIAILESPLSVGGGFNQALNAVMQMQRLCTGKYDFQVLTISRENVALLEKYGIRSELFPYSFFDRLLAVMSLNAWWQSVQKRMRFVGGFEKTLIRTGCDLVYFVSPTEKIAALQTLNAITTVWDLCHRDVPEFPEVRSFYETHARERFFQNHLYSSIAIVTDSEALSTSLNQRYGIDSERLLAMPFSPAPFESGEKSLSTADVLQKYMLVADYFFYPAQFWPHKNHIRILEALVQLNVAGVRPRVVFSGGDQGNRKRIEQFVECNHLGEQVRFLDFVPATDMPGLYKACRAVLMPTYFGPTNLPPLEAWTFDKPLIYSKHFVEQVGDAAILIDPDSADELATALVVCSDAAVCAELAGKGRQRLETIHHNRQASEMRLLAILERFEKRLRCWKE
jgi:glycosyltransferase involved in cell wall biosynthesis